MIILKKLYDGNIKKNFFVFAFPLVLTVLFSQAYNIINTIMAGYLLGDNAISAIGSTAPFLSLISSLLWGYGTGFSIYASILFGRGDYAKMFNIIKVNVLFAALFAVLVSVLCINFHEYIFHFLNIESGIWDDSFSYFSIYMGGLVFLLSNWYGVYISNAIGITVLPLIASLITNVLNIAGNYILIKYFGLGVAGTAIATVFSAFCVTVFYIIMIVRAFRKMGVRTGGIYFNKDELYWSWKFSFPTTLQQSIMYLCSALTSPLTNLCGASAIAGYTVGMRLYDLNAGIYQNANKTVSNYIAQCVGAGKHSMIKKGIQTGTIQTSLFLLPFLAVTVFGAGMISRLFLDSPESLHYSEVFMRYCMPFVVFNVANNLFHAIFRSTGAGGYLVTSTVIYSVSRFGFSYLLFRKFGMYGIYAGVVLSWVVEAIFGLIIYLSGKWKTDEYRIKEKIEQ